MLIQQELSTRIKQLNIHNMVQIGITIYFILAYTKCLLQNLSKI